MPLRSLALAVLALGIVLLVIGFAVGSDVLGFLFMLCLVAAIVVFVTDAVVRRRAA
jgi:hypothetical protein